MYNRENFVTEMVDEKPWYTVQNAHSVHKYKIHEIESNNNYHKLFMDATAH